MDDIHDEGTHPTGGEAGEGASSAVEIKGSASPLLHPWALLDDEHIHISMVGCHEGATHGVDEDYRCVSPFCGQPLRARALTSAKQRAHFTHPKGHPCAFDPESSLHIVAKQLIGERRYMRLPELREYQRPDSGRVIEEERIGHWRTIETEKTILGRWRADLLHTGEIASDDVLAKAFAIVTDEQPTPLIVEVVVSSKVRVDKILAVQRAGWRMVAVYLDRDAAQSASIDQIILHNAPRQWLAHPAWTADWKAAEEEMRRGEEDRRQRDLRAAEEIRQRISEGQRIHWNALEEPRLREIAGDYGLVAAVQRRLPYGHWMAASHEWWKLDLIDKAIIAPLETGTAKRMPPAKEALELIRGYVIPGLPEKPKKALLAVMGRNADEWGSPSATVEAYVASLVDDGVLKEDGQDVVVAGDRLSDLAARHRQIRALVMPTLQEGRTGRAAAIAYRNWKKEAREPEGPTRRKMIQIGGEPYQSVLNEAMAIAERHRADIDDAHPDDNKYPRHMPMQKVPQPVVETGESPLAAVEEGLVEHTLGNDDDAPSSDDIAKAAASVATAAGIAAGGGDAGKRASLLREAHKAFNRARRGKGDQFERAEVWMTTPMFDGARPIDICVEAAGYKRCMQDLARQR